MLLKKVFEGFRIDSVWFGYSPRTVRTFLQCLEVFSNFLGSTELAEIARDDLVKYFQYLGTEFKPKRFSNSEKTVVACNNRQSLDRFEILLQMVSPSIGW